MDQDRWTRAVAEQLSDHASALNDLDKRIRKHAGAINGLHAQLNNPGASYVTEVESLSKYNSIVVGVGYAGFFGLWAMVREQQPAAPQLHALAALFVAASLTAFVFWEVFTMWARTAEFAFAKPGQSKQSVAWRIGHWINERQLAIWPWQFGFTLVTGLAGMGLLVWSMIRQVVQAFSA